jgi:hypothetical protein
MAAAKRSKNGESELQRGEDDREDLAPGVDIATQGEEGGSSKKVRARKFESLARKKFLRVRKPRVNSEKS